VLDNHVQVIEEQPADTGGMILASLPLACGQGERDAQAQILSLPGDLPGAAVIGAHDVPVIALLLGEVWVFTRLR
jgi:hypothetical protein